MNQFKVGNRVEAMIGNGWVSAGEQGTVVDITRSGNVGIEFDNYVNGHNCVGKSKDGHGWYLITEYVKLINKEEIIIYRNDRTITAVKKVNGKAVKSAVAKCNPSDTFDFELGAKIAIDRLLGIEKEISEIPFNFKVRCVDTARQNHLYTFNKIYDVVDGVFTWDDGIKSINHGYEKFKNIDKLNYKLSARFEKVKEDKIVAQSTYAVGDTVKIKDVAVDKCAKCHNVFKEDFAGKTLEIIKLGNSENTYKFKNHFCAISISNIEGKVITGDVSAVKEVKRIAKVGEFVKVLSGDGHTAPVGGIYEVTKVFEKDIAEGWVEVYCTDNAYRTKETLRLEQYAVMENYTK